MVKFLETFGVVTAILTFILYLTDSLLPQKHRIFSVKAVILFASLCVFLTIIYMYFSKINTPPKSYEQSCSVVVGDIGYRFALLNTTIAGISKSCAAIEDFRDLTVLAFNKVYPDSMKYGELIGLLQLNENQIHVEAVTDLTEVYIAQITKKLPDCALFIHEFYTSSYPQLIKNSRNFYDELLCLPLAEMQKEQTQQLAQLKRDIIKHECNIEYYKFMAILSKMPESVKNKFLIDMSETLIELPDPILLTDEEAQQKIDIENSLCSKARERITLIEKTK